MILSRNSLALAIAMTFAAPYLSANETAPTAAVEINPLQAQIITFEEASLPEFVQLNGEGNLSLSKQRFINGEQSLRWDWQPNSELNLDQTFHYYTEKQAYDAVGGRQSSTVFSVWIYNEKPSDGELAFQFGNASQSHFSMKMNFTGWRTVGMSFSRDMKGMPSSTMSGLTITPKGMTEGGTMFIDRVMVGIDDARYQWSDDLVTTAISLPEIDYGLPKQLPKATPTEIAAADLVKQKLLEFHIGQAKGNKKLVELRDEVAQYRLSKVDGVINGAHVLTNKQDDIYQINHLSEFDRPLVGEYVDFRKFAESMERVAQMWHTTTDAKVKQEMEATFLLMTEHLLDQGFQDGASLVALHHWGYSSRAWYASLLLMEEPLKKAGLFQATFDSLLWSAREFKERGFDMKVGPKSSDMDYYNTLARAHMIMLLMEPNDDRRVALLKKYGQFISGNLEQTPVGYGDGFRPDGTAFRHRGNYPGYSFAALEVAGHVSYMLHGTPFALSEGARDYLKKVMLAARIYSNPNPGVGTNGRRPFFNISLKKMADGYRWLAQSNGATVDTELAAAYLRITEQNAADAQAIFGQAIEPEAHPQGAYVYNYAAMGIHRYQDKMVTMKGWNRYVWSAEIYNVANRYGRYQSHGSLQIQNWGDEAEYGYDEDGWDWNRMPGATTIHLPWKWLDAPRVHTTMLQNEVRFNGATALDGKYGAFGFTLQNPDRFATHIDPSFTFNKSAFSFDNRIVTLGSDISNSREQYQTETTLFQHGITEKAATINVNGNEVTEFPYQATLNPGDWVIDGMGNGYYVVSGGEIEVRRQEQESRDNQRKQPTFGNMASAWIKHGTAPQEGEFEYMIILDATAEKMAQLATQMQSSDTKPYEVIRKDSNVHVVRDKQTGVTGYTAFKFTRVGDEFVRTISTSAVVMTQFADEQLKVSVANPDINMEVDTLSQVVPTSVTLNGKWALAQENEQVVVKRKGARTTVTFLCRDGLPIQVSLKKA